MPCTSEPAFGSVMARHNLFCPESISVITLQRISIHFADLFSTGGPLFQFFTAKLLDWGNRKRLQRTVSAHLNIIFAGNTYHTTN